MVLKHDEIALPCSLPPPPLFPPPTVFSRKIGNILQTGETAVSGRGGNLWTCCKSRYIKTEKEDTYRINI